MRDKDVVVNEINNTNLTIGRKIITLHNTEKTIFRII